MNNLVVSFERYLQASYSAHTSLAYKRDIKEFMQFLVAYNLTVESLQSEHIFTFFQHIAKKRVSAATALRKIAALRCFFKYIAAEHHLPDMSFTLETTVGLSQKRIAHLIENYRDKTTYNEMRIYLILSLLATGKITVSNLAVLRTYNFCFKTSTAKLEGTHQTRTIQLPEDFFSILKQYLTMLPTSSTYLFQTKVGITAKPLSTQALRSILKIVLFPQVPLPSSSTSIDSDLKETYTKKHPRP